jgi:transposase-like protein
MDFAIDGLMDEQKCYDWLLSQFHPNGLDCPKCKSKNKIIQMTVNGPVIRYECKSCQKYFTVYTGSAFEQTHFPCSKVVLILRGFLQGQSTAQISRELEIDYSNLLRIRHTCQAFLLANSPQNQLKDTHIEVDEMFQNAGEKGTPHPDPEDPPRRRANKKKDMALMQTTDPPF